MERKFEEHRNEESLEYTLNSKDIFYPIGAEILKESCMKNFLNCLKISYRGTIKLVYDISEYESLDKLMPNLNLKQAINIFFNLVSIVLNVKNNGYIQVQNIAMNFSRIFIEKNKLDVYLVYIPIDEPKRKFDSIEKRVKKSISNAIIKNTALMNPALMGFFKFINEEDTTLLEIRQYMEKDFEDLLEKDSIVELSDTFEINDELLNSNISDIEYDEIIEDIDDTNNENTSSEFIVSDYIKKEMDNVVKKIRGTEAENDILSTQSSYTDEKTENDLIKSLEGQIENIIDKVRKTDIEQYSDDNIYLEENEFIKEDINEKNIFIEETLEEIEENNTFIEESNNFEVEDNSIINNVLKQPVLIGIEKVRGIVIEINKDEIIIGSKAEMADIVLGINKTISRKHCKILNIMDTWYIMDLGSTNGTFLNGEKLKVEKIEKLNENDVVKISNLEFVFGYKK